MSLKQHFQRLRQLTPSQPAFQAINLEPEENAEEQIDTTKEIHVGFQTMANYGTRLTRARLGR